MEYNTTKSKLTNGEYGRHIQKMVEYAVEIKDRNLRTQQANAIVRTMSFFSAGTKDTDDYWHKLWDHLFIISDYKLDVDAPFPMPKREEEKRTMNLQYPKHEIKFRPYGYLIESIINKMIKEENCYEKEQAIVNVANHLKKQYLNWNRNSVSDDLIEEHLKELSDGKLRLKPNFRFSSTKAILDDIEKTASMSVNTSVISKNKNKKKRKKPGNPNIPNNQNNQNNPNNQSNQNHQNHQNHQNNPNNGHQNSNKNKLYLQKAKTNKQPQWNNTPNV